MMEGSDIKDFFIDKKNWRPVKFGDVVYEPKETSKDPIAEGIEHVVGLEHIDSEDIHLRRSASIEETTTFTKKFAVGDILFGRRRAYLKKASQASFPGICSGDITVMRATDQLMAELLPFIVNNDKFFDYAITHSAGGLSPRVKFRDLADYEFLLPPSEQQIEIAGLLRAMDGVVVNHRNLKESALRHSQSLQKEMFENRVDQKSGIMDLANVRRGKFTPRPRNNPKFFGGSIPFIQTAEVIKSKSSIDGYTQTLNEDGLRVSKMFPKGTIVMVIAGTYVGSCAVLSFDSAFTDSLLGITSYGTDVTQDYLFYYMRFYEKKIDSFATEVAQRNLSIDSFQPFQVSYPKCFEKQSRICKTVQSLDQKVTTIEVAAAKAKLFQKSLIQQVF